MMCVIINTGVITIYVRSDNESSSTPCSEAETGNLNPYHAHICHAKNPKKANKNIKSNK